MKNNLVLPNRYPASVNTGQNRSNDYLFVPTNGENKSSYLTETSMKAYIRKDDPSINNPGSYLTDKSSVLLTTAQQQAYEQQAQKRYASPTDPISDNAVETHNKNIYLPESTNGELIFNWDSSYKSESMRDFNDKTEKQLQFLGQLFDSQARTTNGLIQDATDFDGKRIINNTSERQWFKDYVALVFSIGCIFNQNDQTKLNEILKCFENNGNVGFLMNYHKVMTYEDPLVQAIEKKLEIGNGNYHLFLVPIVQTKDPKILQCAPEQKYSFSGTVDKFCEWNDIYNYMQTIVARYGLMTPTKVVLEHREPSDRQSWEIGQTDLATKTVRHSEVESNFDIDIDPNDENQIRLNTELEFRHEQDEHFKPRVREVLRARSSENDNPNRQRVKTNKSLYSRIAESIDPKIASDSVIDEHKGVQLRLNEAIQPPQKKTNEFQLYEDDSTYENGRNIIDFSTDQSSRQYIPSFQHTNITSTRHGNHTRIPTNNPLQQIKTPIPSTGI